MPSLAGQTTRHRVRSESMSRDGSGGRDRRDTSAAHGSNPRERREPSPTSDDRLNREAGDAAHPPSRHHELGTPPASIGRKTEEEPPGPPTHRLPTALTPPPKAPENPHAPRNRAGESPPQALDLPPRSSDSIPRPVPPVPNPGSTTAPGSAVPPDGNPPPPPFARTMPYPAVQGPPASKRGSEAWKPIEATCEKLRQARANAESIKKGTLS